MKSLILPFLLLFLGATAQAEDMTFQQGLTFFQTKDYAKAKEFFEKAAKDHPQEASIFHNWALAELQAGRKGEALALWRKALSVDPAFLPARKGRDYIEGRFQMRAFEKDPWARSTRREIESVGMDELLASVALLLGLSGWLWLRYFRKRRTAYQEMLPNPPFPSVATIFSILLLLGTTVLTLKFSQRFVSRATITGDKVSAKSLPNDQSVALYDLGEGVEVLVKRRQDTWLQVTNSDGLTGWVPAHQLRITSGPEL